MASIRMENSGVRPVSGPEQYQIGSDRGGNTPDSTRKQRRLRAVSMATSGGLSCYASMEDCLISRLYSGGATSGAASL